MNTRTILLGVAVISLACFSLAADEQAGKTISSAKILIKNKDFDGAKRMLAPVIEQDANIAEAVFLVASCDENLGNVKDAIDGYNRCFELLKSDPNADATMKKQSVAAIGRLDEGKKIVLAHAKQMEQEAAKLKDKNEYAYATVLAAVKLISGDELDAAASSQLQSKRHPKDAVEFRGHWYKFFDVSISWHLAKQKCEEMGGTLACVESREENDFLSKIHGNQRAWIGGTDEEKEGEWRWINGAPMKYTNWRPGQPDNANVCESGLHLVENPQQYNGAWNDVSSDYRMGFICEWEK